MRAWWLTSEKTTTRNGEWARRRRSPIPRAAGSALILTVVLTSLLAIVGVLFIMTTRLDKLGSSAASDNAQLEFAVESVVSQISEVLANDVNDLPGTTGSHSYYDYPDPNNPWLADLEPNQVYNRNTREWEQKYYWRQITNLTNPNHQSRFNGVMAEMVAERAAIVDPNTEPNADADGDGVSDARWCRLTGIVSSKGRPIYGAVRIIDNGGMLNLNTGWTSDPATWNDTMKGPLDGTSLLQIGVAENAAAASLPGQRDPNGVGNLTAYENAVIWRYLPRNANSPYTPFDISDELDLRYRFILNRENVHTRAENWGQFRGKSLFEPLQSGGRSAFSSWGTRVTAGAALDPNYAFCHLLTTYNMDRILMPGVEVDQTKVWGQKRVNVNTAGEDEMKEAVRRALASRRLNDRAEDDAAKITANLRDYIDENNDVSVISGRTSASGPKFYGFERPCVCLSEIAYGFTRDVTSGSVSESYAIELFKPFEDGNLPNDKWRIEVSYAGAAASAPVRQFITWSGTRRFHVLHSQNTLQAPSANFTEPNEVAAEADRGFVRTKPPVEQLLAAPLLGAAKISLQRDVAGNWVEVDYKTLPVGFASPAVDPNDPNSATGATRCLQRDVRDGKRVLRLWSGIRKTANLGSAAGNYASDSSVVVQAFPANKGLSNIGELGMIFKTSAYSLADNSQAKDLLIDLCNPAFAGLFNYLTVMDPSRHGHANEETRIMGRINVNTAPWRVLAALPWIKYPSDSNACAQAIVTYRDTAGAFKSIGDLMQVPDLRNLGGIASEGGHPDNLDNLNTDTPPGPDLTPDTVRDDYEERDLIFTRISDLVTVRSDVFTAYILVRLGEKGPQKRMVAILDRSTVTPESPKVRLVALHPVADPR